MTIKIAEITITVNFYLLFGHPSFMLSLHLGYLIVVDI